MTLDIDMEITRLRSMTVKALREEYLRVFEEETRSHHKEYLVRRIVWQIQAKAEGGLSDRARRRAKELADESYLRTRAPPRTRPGRPPGVQSAALRLRKR